MIHANDLAGLKRLADASGIPARNVEPTKPVEPDEPQHVREWRARRERIRPLGPVRLTRDQSRAARRVINLVDCYYENGEDVSLTWPEWSRRLNHEKHAQALNTLRRLCGDSLRAALRAIRQKRQEDRNRQWFVLRDEVGRAYAIVEQRPAPSRGESP